jgi:hypothetical protein
MVYIVGGVLSQAEGFASLSELWGALAFHAIAMAMGTLCIGRAVRTDNARADVVHQ